jgi:hypothetical protein
MTYLSRKLNALADAVITDSWFFGHFGVYQILHLILSQRTIAPNNRRSMDTSERSSQKSNLWIYSPERGKRHKSNVQYTKAKKTY